MNQNIVTKLQNGLGKALTYFILLSCLAILGLYLIQRFGAHYAQQKIQQQLEHSGLAPFIHYQAVHFDPFSLTPSLEGVRFGNETTAWLRFARISLNHYPIKYPNLDVDFWIQESPIDSLSHQTRRAMRAAGISRLLGKGAFSSSVENEKVSSQFSLDIKDVGKLFITSKINLLDQTISLSDLRSDLLTSIALGQLDAMLILYGEAIELRSLEIKYQESGLISHLFPQSALLQHSEAEQLQTLKFSSQTLGLAPADSKEAEQIATRLQSFLKKPEELDLMLSPASPISLKQLALLAYKGTLYKDSKMTLSND